jgi:hypothetical protein
MSAVLTRQDRIGLVLAFLLGLGDVAILGALGEDDPSLRPPAWVVVLSVALGVATLVLVAMAWRHPSRQQVLGIVVLRAVSGLGSLAGVTEGGSVLVISLAFLVANALCVVLLRGWLARPVPAVEARTDAVA